ncbi:hypothetical protein HDU76_007725, partial [Blyttiomyces sp. JEL0837]
MENRLPAEVIDLVYENTDILTKYLNNRLTNTEIETQGNDIWSEAFRQDWQGDLNLLPQDGFPTALTGLCNVQTRSMYERLCQHRPDLAGISDSFKVYLRADTRYGYFSKSDHRPIVLLDDDDDVEIGLGTPLVNYEKPVYEDVLSKPVIQIAMRQCWIEDLQPLIKMNRNRLFLLALKMRHDELAMKLVKDWGIVVVGNIMVDDFVECMEEIGKCGHLRLLMHLNSQNVMYWNLSHPGDSVMRRIIKGAMETGQLAILRYIQQEFSGTLHFTNAISVQRTFNYEPFKTHFFDCWEWNVDVCNNRNVVCDTLLVVKTLDEARRVIHKLGHQHVSYRFLLHAALNSNPETFKYLWDHRNPGELDLLLNETDGNTAKFKLLNSFPVELLNFEAVRLYHGHNPGPEKVIQLFYAAAERSDLDVVQYLYSTGDIVLEDPLFTLAIQERNLNVIKLFGDSGPRGALADINTAALSGNIDAVKFFHKHCCEETKNTTTGSCGNIACRKLAATAFRSAASKGDFEMVMFFIENGRDDCNLEEGLCEAIRCGRFRLVRYFYALGVTELMKDKSVLADVKNWLAIKSGKGKMA